MTEVENAALPLFYRKPALLRAQEHANLAIMSRSNYSFSARVNSIPAVLGEIRQLVPHYPVAFSLGDEPMLMAIVGARNDENLFVDEKGTWEPGRYIPAYARRYPFVLMELPDKTPSLAAELDSGYFGLEGERIFENGRPTAYAVEVFRFCMELQKGFAETQEFCRAVHESGLLKSKRSTMTTPSGKTFTLSGFAAVDEEDLRDLDNRTANAWRKKGWLAALYWHIGSLGQLNAYSARLDEVSQDAGPAGAALAANG